MKKIFTIFVMVLACTSAWASRDWKGKVLDENGQPVSYATVALMSKADSTIVTGVTTGEDGSFTLVTDKKDGIVMIAMLGYKTQYIYPRAGMEIRLEPDNAMLEGAVATAVMPKVKLTGEGLQTSVRGSVLENIGSAKDVLNRTPGLISGQNGLEVIGKGSPVVYINGHKVTDSGELERLQSNEIQSVEVITNPGSQYDATVRAVVRIRTVRRQGEGFGFNVNLSDEQSLRHSYNDPSAILNANYRVKSVDIFAGIGAKDFHNRQDADLTQTYSGAHPFRQEGVIYNEFGQKAISMDGGVNWQIAAAHSVGFKFENTTSLDVTHHEVMSDKLYSNGILEDDINTIGEYSIGDKRPDTFSSNMYYNGMVGKLGIDFNFDIYGGTDYINSDIVEKSAIKDDAEISTSSASKANLYATKLVLSYPVWLGQVQAGTEETFSRAEDDYTISGSAIPASSSKVKEDNIAAFASYAFVLAKRAQVNAGLRYEHVSYEYEDLIGNSSFTKNYDNIYPSLAVAGAAGPVQIMANYSAKTLRPAFSQMSNAIRYNNKYTLQSGNATLQPQKINDFNLMANYKWLTFVADYSRTDDAIFSWMAPYNDEGVNYIKPVNLDTPQRQLSVYLNAIPTLGPVTLNYTAGMQNEWVTVGDKSFNDKPLFFAKMLHTYSNNKGLQLELGGEIHSHGYVQNCYISNTYFNFTAAVQQAFLKDRSLIVRLSGNDLAGLARDYVDAYYGNLVLKQDNIMDTQRIILSVKYRFNSAQSKYKGSGAGKDAASRMK